MNRSYSKIRHIQESNKILEKRIISEQLNIEQGDASECAKRYINFVFEVSILAPDEDNEKGFVVQDGGDLYYWNNNIFPIIGDKEAYNRFINYLKSVDYLFDDEECTGIKFEDMEPFLKKLYQDKIYKSMEDSGINIDMNLMKRRDNQIKSLIEKAIDYVKKESLTFETPYDFAQQVIDWVVEDLQDTPDFPKRYRENQIIDFVKHIYGEKILSRYEGDPDYTKFGSKFGDTSKF